MVELSNILTDVIGYSKRPWVISDVYSSYRVVFYNTAINGYILTIYVCVDGAGTSGSYATITTVRDFTILDKNVLSIANTDASKAIIVGIMNPEWMKSILL